MPVYSSCSLSRWILIQTLITCFFSMLFAPAVASSKPEPLLLWHSTNVQLLYGENFELGDKERTIVTLEHANKWRYGDNYLFVDKVIDGDTANYFEWHPRLSLSKMSGKALSWGPLKDILLAATWEVPDGLANRRLIGFGFDWTVPGLKFFKTNIYRRDNPSLEGTTWGTTFTWGANYKFKGYSVLFNGFWDMAGSEGSREAYQLLSPALLLDVGRYYDLNDTIYLGIEYQYWHNKFGLRGVTESFAQLELRWVL